MSVIERIWINFRQQKFKNIILFVLITSLGSFIASIMLTSQAFVMTERNLRHSLPPITSTDSIPMDDNDDFEFIRLSRDSIHEVGNLPYVNFFDYSFLSDIWVNYEMYVLEEFGNRFQVEDDWTISFRMHGVSHPEVVYFDNGMYELYLGRTFLPEEMSDDYHGVAPIIVSRQFLEMNDFGLGDIIKPYRGYFTFPEGAVVPEQNGDYLTFISQFWDYWGEMEFEFKIVGAFEYTREITRMDTDWDLLNHQTMINLFFVPNWRAFEIQRILDENLEYYIELLDIGHLRGTRYIRRVQEEFPITPIWVLNDMRDIENFTSRANEILLPYSLEIQDLSGTFGQIVDSAENLQGTITVMLYVLLGMMVIASALILIVVVHERKQEIGIYLVLGERKWKIVSQILAQVLVITIISLIIALLVANIFSYNISREMLLQHLLANPREVDYWPTFIEFLGFGQQMSVEEMMSAFNVSLDFITIVRFMTIGIGTVLVSAIIPTTYILELKPSEILQKGKVE